MSNGHVFQLWDAPLKHLPASWRALTRSVVAVGLSGVVAGVLIGGVGGRLVMRASSLLSPAVSGRGIRTEQGFRIGEVTLDGSIDLVVFIGIFSGLFGAVYYAITRPWLKWMGRWHGAAFGVLLFAIGNATSDVLNPDNIDFFLLDNVAVIVLMFFVLFVLFGVLTAWLYDWFDRRLPEPGNSGPIVGVYGAASLFSLIFFGGAMVMLVTGQGCDCDTPLVSGFAFVVLAAATIGMSVRRASGRFGAFKTLTAIGWIALSVAFIAGAIRALSDIADILAL